MQPDNPPFNTPNAAGFSMPAAPDATSSGVGYAPAYPSYPPAPPNAQFPQPTYSSPGFPTQGQQPGMQYPVPQSYPYLGVYVTDPNALPAPVDIPNFNPKAVCTAILEATKGMGTNESLLIKTLAHLDVPQMQAVSQNYVASTGTSLLDSINKETSGWFRDTLRGLILGPLGFDVHLVYQAISGLGTNEEMLIEIILGRSRSELELLKIAYAQRYGRALKTDLEGDLSGNLKKLFVMALEKIDDQGPVDTARVNEDVERLYKAGQGRPGTNEIEFCEIIIGRSRPHLAAICETYASTYKSLSKVIKSEFSKGHMRTALLFVINGAKPKRAKWGECVYRDAKLLEASMKGFGTNNAMLVCRVLRAHWDKTRFEKVKSAYQAHYNKSLHSRVKGETSGEYRKLLLTIVDPGQK